ncbi:urease accessory protein UreF [Halomonas sp. MCCC 1A17488]|uniref:urease accessory protein UreF n=2 Tax=Halomonas TaxID=2745 RepID=UPI0018D22606|nr:MULTISPECIES: urease accessory UreF family protein [unclassified Halomonas]MCE8015394.1 urease accessory protein UreF [Halomonas sp. MCCC 1A17488]MCG3238727.1 urease accessory protein UreF [Halomonas sp. MCCC 1A17488]QPP51581.1 urease accessory protein UreF [Halomonas sp. SS10-MC5]
MAITMPIEAASLRMAQGDDLALLGLLQLVSPALPIGAFAFSQGLESAFELGWVKDEASLGDWLTGVLDDGLSRCELPVLARLQQAWAREDEEAIAWWDSWLAANRETAELAAEDSRLGASLSRLLGSLNLLPEGPSRESPAMPPGAGYVTVFAWAAQVRGVAPRQAMLGFAWAWLENQLAVACKALPLGHTAAQRLVERLRPALVAAVDEALALEDDELGPALPGLALASALHETQYSRLFRS